MSVANVTPKARKPSSTCPNCGGMLIEKKREIQPTQVGDAASGAVKASFAPTSGYTCMDCDAEYDKLPINKSLPPPNKPSTYPKLKRSATPTTSTGKKRSTKPPTR